MNNFLCYLKIQNSKMAKYYRTLFWSVTVIQILPRILINSSTNYIFMFHVIKTILGACQVECILEFKGSHSNKSPNM